MEEKKNLNDKTCNCETIAMASIPCQKWSDLYDLSTALNVGTIFKDLHKPFFMGGDNNDR